MSQVEVRGEWLDKEPRQDGKPRRSKPSEVSTLPARKRGPMPQANSRTPEALVLDLCCGTGDLAFSLDRAGHARAIGADFSHTMLVRAKEKSRMLTSPNGSQNAPTVAFFEADALRLPFAGASFDLVTAAFGFRNLANYDAGLIEIRRVLKSGGMLAILEFTEPPDGFFGNIYRWYFQKILPRIGGSGDASAYAYLPASVSRSFRPAELAALIASVG
jgi:demethylmenaquinone methyltransferase / 2-methoxy-6-polyprenyl-1,4-benzoquinol methylase